MNIKITGDSTCDLSAELKQKYNIDVMPLNVSLGERNGFDGETITTDDIFSYYEETKQLPNTASRSVEDYVDFFKKFTSQGCSVIHYSLSSEMSSSYNNACMAAKEVENVFVVDSKSLSTGTALLMLDAFDMAQAGCTPQQIVERSNKRVPSVQASFVIDNLAFLHHGGRCSTVAYLATNLLSIRPSIEVNDGKMGLGKKFVGRFEKCIKKYADDVKETYTKPDKTRCFVTHSQMDSQLVQNLVETVKSWNIFDEVLITEAGCTITTHCGRNTIGILFINDGE